MAAEELRRRANLGPKSAAMLAAAGVRSVEHPRRLGAVAAYAMARQTGAPVSLLPALEAHEAGKR